MNTLHKLLIKSLFLSLVFVLPVTGQISWSFNTSQEYNDNPFRTQFPEASIVSSYDLGMEITLNKVEKPYSLSYYGSYNSFSSLTERNFFWHQLSLSKDFASSSFILLAEQRVNNQLYSYYNYSNLSAFYNYKLSVSDYYINLQPNAVYAKYSQIPIMDNVKLGFNFRLNHGFDSETTLIFVSAFNHKIYLNPENNGIYSYFNDNDSLITESFNDQNVSSIQQFNFAFRLAQSLGEKSGIAFQYTNKNILTNFSSKVKDLNTIYGDESEMFDDPVNSEGNNFLIEFTQILFDDFEIKLGYYLNKKLYPSQGVYDKNYNYLINQTRKDDQSIFNLNLKKDFELGETISSLSVGLNYQAIWNTSNSYLFNYKSNAVSLYLNMNL